MASYINQQDYYFGAALSVFFTRNQDARPSLIESMQDARCYEMISDTCDYTFCLYMKHSEKCKNNIRDNSISWTFVFSEKEKQRIQDNIDAGKKMFIVLLCSEGDFNNTVIAVLTQKEYLHLEHKASITIKWEMAEMRRKQKFSIPNRGGKPFTVECDRIKQKFTDIRDAI